MEFKKFNAKKFRSDYIKHLKSLDNEELNELYEGMYKQWKFINNYMRNKYGCSKLHCDMYFFITSIGNEVLKRCKDEIPY